MPTSKNLNNLVINKVQDEEVFEAMKAQGLINTDELYLVKDSASSYMMTSDYDSNLEVKDAGGIAAYVEDNTVPKTRTVNGKALSSNITISASDVGLGNVGNFKAVSTVASQGLTTTEQANARANIGAGTSSFSGSYNDLSNKPTIPTVNNATLTIQKNGTNVGTFTANASSNVTANITVPTQASDVGAVPTTRTVNNKALSSNITISASDVSAIPTSDKGVANGVATLGSDGKVVSGQLPSMITYREV